MSYSLENYLYVYYNLGTDFYSDKYFKMLYEVNSHMEKLYTIVYVKVHVDVYVHKIASSKQGHYNLRMKRFEIIFSCASILLDSFFVLFPFIFIRIS